VPGSLPQRAPAVAAGCPGRPWLPAGAPGRRGANRGGARRGSIERATTRTRRPAAPAERAPSAPGTPPAASAAALATIRPATYTSCRQVPIGARHGTARRDHADYRRAT
jgi:hypothetical protein